MTHVPEQHPLPSSGHARIIAGVLTVAVCLMTLSGCSRRFWREQADQDTYRAISEKHTDERWQTPRMDRTADPRSRFHDPYDPDAEPLPPDDPAAHELMHCVNGKEGYKHWHKFGDAMSVENPNWLEPYVDLLQGGTPEEGHALVDIPKLTLTQCVDLAYIHSREYQTQIESVYLTSLSMTEQRYLLGTRFLLNRPGVGGGLFTSIRERNGTQRQALSNGIGIQQLLPSGAQLSADIVNTITWNMGSGKGSAPRLAWSLTQPLLARAGRKVVLENLTQAERNLLYEIRRMARFRKVLFVDIASDYLAIQRQLQTIINQENNIRQLEEQIEIGRVEDEWTPNVIPEPLRRFPEGVEIPEVLSEKLKYDEQSRALKWTGAMSAEEKSALLALSDDELYQSAAQQLIRWVENQVVSLGVLQLEGRLNDANSAILTSRRALADSLDSFKVRLGLPPNITISLDEGFLDQFKTIDNELSDIEVELKLFAKEEGPSLIPAPVGRMTDREPPPLEDLKSYVMKLEVLRKKLEKVGLEAVREDFVPVRDILAATSNEQLVNMSGGRSFYSREERDRVIRDVAAGLSLYRINERDFERSSTGMRILIDMLQAETSEAMIESLDTDQDGFVAPEEFPVGWESLLRPGRTEDVQKMTGPAFISALRDSVVGIREDLLHVAQSLRVVQAGLRVEKIGLNRFVLPEQTEIPDIEEVVQIGVANRLDLMNARAAVMDSRRLVEIAANLLMSRLDLEVFGVTDPDGGINDDINLSLDFKTPIDQVGLRNDYNAALVEYQRARREYMRQEDLVKQQIRDSWRQLMVSPEQIDIRRQSLRNAALQYDNLGTNPNQNNNLSLLQALDAILRAENQLVGDWINYETNRLNIFRDMGIMLIDSSGVWEDNYYQSGANLTSEDMPAAEDLYPELNFGNPADASATSVLQPLEIPQNE